MYVTKNSKKARKLLGQKTLFTVLQDNLKKSGKGLPPLPPSAAPAEKVFRIGPDQYPVSIQMLKAMKALDIEPKHSVDI